MQRRLFLEVAGGAVAAGALGMTGCIPALRGVTVTKKPATDPIDAASFHSMRRYADTRFGRIAYIERGSGDAALFLHGFPLNGFQWRGAVSALAPYRRCIAPDLMGLGYSEIPERQSVAPDEQVRMLATLLDTLSIGSVDLVASDSGGAVAQLFVARHPDRVRTMLLTNCDVEIDSPPPAFLPIIAQARAGTFALGLASFIADKARARAADGIGGIAYTFRSHPSDEAIDCYFAPLVSSPLRKAQVHAYAIALERNPLAGVEPVLRQTRVPVRIVWGTADRVFSPESADYLDRIFPGSRGVSRVPDAKLFFPEEFPGIIAEEAARLWGVA